MLSSQFSCDTYMLHIRVPLSMVLLEKMFNSLYGREQHGKGTHYHTLKSVSVNIDIFHVLLSSCSLKGASQDVTNAIFKVSFYSIKIDW